MDRRNFIGRLRQAMTKYPVDVLDYMVTSNHIHLLLWAGGANAVSGFMQYIQGTTGRDYNRRKGREGAVWSGRYHPTLIQNDLHFTRCLFYIALNMVRAGVVKHPKEWQSCSDHEIVGNRQRKLVINRDRLIRCAGVGAGAGTFPCSREALEMNKAAAGAVRELPPSRYFRGAPRRSKAASP